MENNNKILDILLIEDEKITQKVIDNLLKTRGWKVTIASDGEEVLNILEHKSFDIALMDIHIPKIDGLQLTKIIRKFIKSKEAMPIIAMTASDISKYEVQGFKIGINAFIAKPIEAKSLFTIIEGIIKKYDNLNPVIDIDTALDHLEGDEELLKELMEDFIKEEYIPALLTDMENAINIKDYTNLYKNAHKLKGAASCLHIHTLSNIAFELEKNGKNKQDNNTINLFNELRKEYNIVEKFFKDYINSGSM